MVSLRVRVGETYYFGSQSVDGCFETEPCPCGRFEEDAGYYLAFEDFLHPVFLELLCHFQYMQDFFFCKIPD